MAAGGLNRPRYHRTHPAPRNGLPIPACPARRRSERGAHAGPGMAEPEAAQPGRPPPGPGTATGSGAAGGAGSSDPARPGLSQQQRASQRKAQVRGFPRGKKLEKLGVFSACKVGWTGTGQDRRGRWGELHGQGVQEGGGASPCVGGGCRRGC